MLVSVKIHKMGRLYKTFLDVKPNKSSHRSNARGFMPHHPPTPGIMSTSEANYVHIQQKRAQGI